ncbi:hypothetical protein BHE74_00019414 [Ensete ventricosum]|nr:hypothetical protein BHE74_00019414 [Ensete ventricosum]
MASRGVTLVLHASWFNRSSWICAKEIVAIRVSGRRAFTSHRISSFRSLMKVPKSCFSDQSSVWLDKRSNLVWDLGVVPSNVELTPICYNSERAIALPRELKSYQNCSKDVPTD